MSNADLSLDEHFLNNFKNSIIYDKSHKNLSYSAPNGDDVIPGHFSLDNNHIWIASGDEETAIESFEALVAGDFEWVASSDGQVPANAVECGKIDGETLYLGRCEHEEGIVMSGYIQPSKATMYMPFDSSVFEKTSYEVLVKRS